MEFLSPGLIYTTHETQGSIRITLVAAVVDKFSFFRGATAESTPANFTVALSISWNTSAFTVVLAKTAEEVVVYVGRKVIQAFMDSIMLKTVV